MYIPVNPSLSLCCCVASVRQCITGSAMLSLPFSPVCTVQDSPEMSCCLQSRLSTRCERGPLSCGQTLSQGALVTEPRVQGGRNCCQGWAQAQPHTHTCTLLTALSPHCHCDFTEFIPPSSDPAVELSLKMTIGPLRQSNAVLDNSEKVNSLTV